MDRGAPASSPLGSPFDHPAGVREVPTGDPCDRRSLSRALGHGSAYDTGAIRQTRRLPDDRTGRTLPLRSRRALRERAARLRGVPRPRAQARHDPRQALAGAARLGLRHAGAARQRRPHHGLGRGCPQLRRPAGPGRGPRPVRSRAARRPARAGGGGRECQPRRDARLPRLGDAEGRAGLGAPVVAGAGAGLPLPGAGLRSPFRALRGVRHPHAAGPDDAGRSGHGGGRGPRRRPVREGDVVRSEIFEPLGRDLRGGDHPAACGDEGRRAGLPAVLGQRLRRPPSHDPRITGSPTSSRPAGRPGTRTAPSSSLRPRRSPSRAPASPSSPGLPTTWPGTLPARASAPSGRTS